MKSMSGFGQAEVKSPQGILSVELRAVNHRFFELRAKLPSQFLALEPKIKSYIRKRIERGMLNLFVSWKTETRGIVNIDRRLAKEYYSKLESLRKELGLKDNLDICLLTQLPEVIKVEESKKKVEKIWPSLQVALRKSMERLLFMKEKEGKDIQQDILKRLKIVERELRPIKVRSSLVVANYRKRLARKVKELSGRIDQDRLSLEVSLFADRADISEELTRFQSLLNQFKKGAGEDKAVGRKLEFTLQEMSREINTIGAKAADSLISRRVIKIKGELEKIREGVQNVE
ncbi:YicC family protein [candidate division NPL-UPA2 bacterium]|nr:YicC family protein [candidate division NPL-UPA2 bacterium]